MAAAITLSILFGLTERGVAVIGVLPQGFPLPSFPVVGLSDLPLLLGAALGMSLVAIGDTISTSAGFAARRGYQVDGYQELVGIGSANLLAGLFSGFPVSTSGSRTTVADAVRGQNAAHRTGGGCPGAGDAAVCAGAGQGYAAAGAGRGGDCRLHRLFDLAELRHLLAIRKSEFTLALACILGVAFLGVLEGIIIAVVLSILQFFERAWRPHSAVLGHTDKLPGYHDVERHPDAERIPGLLVVRGCAPLFCQRQPVPPTDPSFARTGRPPPTWVLITAEPVTDIDTTAAEMLADLDLELNAAGLHLVFAELKEPVQDKFAYGLLETIDRPSHFYPTIEVAIEEFYREQKDKS